MFHQMIRQHYSLIRVFSISICVFLAACSTSKEFTGYDYDPPDVTNTVNKTLNEQPIRVIGTGSPRVWVSNEYDGARLSDFQLVGDTMYQVTILPELAPINNSPWYSFAIWSEEATRIQLKLTYPNANHRYYPKVSSDQIYWKPIHEELVKEDSTCTCLELQLDISKDTLWVSAQEVLTSSELDTWLANIPSDINARIDTVGFSHRNKPLKQLIIDETGGNSNGTLVIVGRQHPPEISGYLTSRYFLDSMMGDSELARSFRNNFKILAYPMANPDGADGGHWRYNVGGVDLNRDWENFNQPETKAIRDAIQSFADEGNEITYGIDFHSTDENLFYPILPSIDKPNGDITYPWITEVIAEFKDDRIRIEPFDINSPIFKNWLFKSFEADALTYEVDDELNRQKLKVIAQFSSKKLMELLLTKFD